MADMDCCTSKSNNESINENKNLNGGKMDRKIIMWIAIAVLVIAVIFLTLKSPASTANAASSAGQAAASQVASSGMVGGC